jgi:hypothetical protein
MVSVTRWTPLRVVSPEQTRELAFVAGSAALATVVHVRRFVRGHLVDGETASSGVQRQRSA